MNGWGAICWTRGEFYEVPQRRRRDPRPRRRRRSFASGLIYGLLAGRDPQWALECGVAHGALAMTTPGDTTMATFAEVMRAMKGSGARIEPMSAASRAEICQRVEAVGIVPVVRAATPELAERAAAAVLAGGISIFEITMTVPNAPAVIRSLVARFGDRAVVGAGTVLSADDARLCIEAGAAFIVSPGLDLPTIAAAHERGVPIMPGALTPTEVITAWKAGADMVKIFPASAVGGAKYLRALRGPLPQVKLLPTGGVNATTAGDYIAAGACALGVGSELVDPAALAAGNDSVLTDRARELVAAVAAARAKL